MPEYEQEKHHQRDVGIGKGDGPTLYAGTHALKLIGRYLLAGHTFKNDGHIEADTRPALYLPEGNAFRGEDEAPLDETVRCDR
ncbi:hypothetical protein DDE01_03800 [Desulfovibrio desulfuricans]|nr:hypothetical protein DDE01_03800 [Desulfovibrio desulfuricans]